MRNFQVLKTNQAIMVWLGLYSYRLNESINEFFYSKSTYYVLINMIFTLISSATYIYQTSYQVEVTLQLWLIIIGGVQCVGMFLSIGCQMKQVKALHLKFQEIVDAGLIFEN